VVVAAGVLMKIRQPAVPERSALSRETVAIKDAPSVLEGQTGVELEKKEADYFSAPDEVYPADQLVKPGEHPADTSQPARDKESAAEDISRVPAMDEKHRYRSDDGDAFMMPATPASPGEKIPLTIMKDSSPEAAGQMRALMEERERALPTGRAVDDGSWGQLAFARKLADEGRQLESEKVLDDLLARDPDLPVQEEASLLLISLLASQNRLPEARQVLDEARRQFPANMMIQNYKLENGK
jgi:hypothetical protein